MGGVPCPQLVLFSLPASWPPWGSSFLLHRLSQTWRSTSSPKTVNQVTMYWSLWKRELKWILTPMTFFSGILSPWWKTDNTIKDIPMSTNKNSGIQSPQCLNYTQIKSDRPWTQSDGKGSSIRLPWCPKIPETQEAWKPAGVWGRRGPPVTEEEKPSQLSAKQQGETKAAGGQLIPW